MKKYISFIFVITLLLSLFTACDREKIDYGLNDEDPAMQGKGNVQFSFALEVETRAFAVDDYIITILDSDQNQVGESYTYGQLPQEGIALNVGTYTIQAKSHADFDMTQPGNYAYYVGSEEFEIKKGETTTIDKLVCTMQNIKVEMTVAESLAEILDTYKVTATFKAGETVLSFSYDQSNTGDPFTFFPAINESNILIVQLTGMSGTTKVDMSKTYTGVEAGDYRRITFIYSENIASGSADINLAIDAVCEVVNKNITVPGIDGGGTDPGTDPGDNDIEIVGENFDGNSFDIVNDVLIIPYVLDPDDAVEIDLVVKINAPQGIQNLWVIIDSQHLEGGLLAAAGLDNTFDLVNPGENENSLQTLGFQTGDQLYTKTEADFDITMFTAILSVMDPGEHNFTIKVIDQADQLLERTLKLKVQ